MPAVYINDGNVAVLKLIIIRSLVYCLAGNYCSVCNISCDTAAILSQHRQSPRHLATVQKCEHMQSFPTQSSHAKTENGSRAKDPADTEYVFSKTTGKGFCHLCNIELTSESHAKSHIQGQKHQKRSRQLEYHVKNSQTEQTWHVDPVHIRINLKPTKYQVQTAAAAASAYTMFNCAICGMQFNGSIQLQEHQKCDKHLNKAVMLYERQGYKDLPMTCTACGQTFIHERGRDYMYHFESKEHYDQVYLVKMKEKEIERNRNMNTQAQSTEQIVDSSSPLFCEVCNISCSSLQNKEDHMKGKKHIRNLENMNIRNRHAMIETQHSKLQAAELNEQTVTDTFHTFPNDRPLLQNSNFTENQNEKVIVKEKPAFVKLEKENTYDASSILLPENIYSTSLKPLNTRPVMDNPVEHLSEKIQSLNMRSEEQQHNKVFNATSDTDDIAKATHLLDSADKLSLGTFETRSCISDLESESDLCSSRYTEPYRIVRNNLEGSFTSFPIGRGRGVFQFAESLPRKVANTDNKLDKHLEKQSKEDISTETFQKETWNSNLIVDASHAASALNSGQNDICSTNNIKSEGGACLAGEGLHYNENFADAPIHTGSSKQPGFECTNINQAIQQVKLPANTTSDEYDFDEIRGTGRCYICKVDFTSRQHKDQHVSGKNHRKVQRSLGVISSFESRFESADNFLVCKVCSCTFTCLESKQQHLESVKHKQNVEKLQGCPNIETYYCDVCKVPCSSLGNYEQHLAGAQHRKMSGTSLSAPLSGQGIDQTQWYPCEVCKCSLNSYEQLQIHERSPAHMKKLEKLQSSGLCGVPFDRTVWFSCELCGCQLNSREQLQIHERSPKHLAKVMKPGGVQTSPTNTQLPQSDPSLFQSSGSYLSNRYITESPLDSFLSQELFPTEFLPEDIKTPPPAKIPSPVELQMTDEPFVRPDRFGYSDDNVISNSSQNKGSSKPRGQMSDIAFATRNVSSNVTKNRDTVLGASTADNQNTNSNNVNPYAETHAFYCHTCKAPMNTQDSYEAHVKGKRHLQKVCSEQAPEREHIPPKHMSDDNLPYTRTKPRNYQLELYRKTVARDCLVFLPTGK